MKKIFVILLCIACLLGLTVTALAERILPSVIDDAGLLKENEEASLQNRATSLQNAYGIDIVILTVDSIGGRSPRQYAENYYDMQGYADDGILLLISMEERDWYICTTGRCRDIFTEYGIDKLGDEFGDHLSDGNYFSAFSLFLEQIPLYCDAYSEGEPIDASLGLSHVVICLLTGAAIGGITIAIMRSAMNSTRPQHSAVQYVDRDSFRMYGNFDMYLYSRVTKTPRQQANSSGPHGGGGSRSHSGGGGKF